MRRLGSHNDRINAPFAGFISALSMAVDSKSRRMLFSVLMLSRAMDVSFSMVEGKDRKIPHRDLVLFITANIFLQTTYAYESDLMNKGLSKFFKSWAKATVNDKLLMKVWHQMYENRKTTGF